MTGVVFLLLPQTRKVVLSHFRIGGPSGWEPLRPSTYLRESWLQGAGFCHPCIVEEEGEGWGRGPWDSWRAGRVGFIHFAVLLVSRCVWLTTSGQVWNEGRKEDEQNSHHREAEEKKVNGPDLMASSAEFESLSLHALPVCTWPHCASAFHLLKTDDNGGDDDDDENDDNRMYISGLFSRWNVLICIKHLELCLVHGKGSLSLLVALHETNRTVWVRKGVRDCVFPLHHGLCPWTGGKELQTEACPSSHSQTA